VHKFIVKILTNMQYNNHHLNRCHVHLVLYKIIVFIMEFVTFIRNNIINTLSQMLLCIVVTLDLVKFIDDDTKLHLESKSIYKLQLFPIEIKTS
jgi:hypothetical protein